MCLSNQGKEGGSGTPEQGVGKNSDSPPGSYVKTKKVSVEKRLFSDVENEELRYKEPEEVDESDRSPAPK